MKVLVVNAGSSSLKFQLFDMEKELWMAKGVCERLGSDAATMSYEPKGQQKIEVEQD